MIARFRSWWQQIKQHRVAIGVVGIGLAVVIALIIAGYWLDWTGFDGYNQVTTAHTITGPSAGTVVRTVVYQPGKALWDWLQLAIIPAAIAFGVLWFSRLKQQRYQQLADQRANSEREAAEKQAQVEREAAEKRAETEREIAEDNQREAALKEYYNTMSELLLHENLRTSQEGAEVRNIARVWTLTVLPRLDKFRKAYVLQFLNESGLIHKDKKFIDLNGADLREAELFGLDLNEVDLSEAQLLRANLRKAGLSEAKLIKAFLSEAKLGGAVMIGAIVIGANLTGADLSGAIMMSASLINANLSGADLSGADLTGVNLSRADLTGADLTGADLHHANLREAKVTFEQLDKAWSLEDATLPDGTIHA